MKERCRLCLEKNVALINIFDDRLIERNMIGKINMRLQIYVHIEDALPKTICFNCYGKLDRFDKFYEQVHSNEIILHKKIHEISARNALKEEPQVIDSIEIIDDDPPPLKPINENITSRKRLHESIDADAASSLGIEKISEVPENTSHTFNKSHQESKEVQRNRSPTQKCKNKFQRKYFELHPNQETIPRVAIRRLPCMNMKIPMNDNSSASWCKQNTRNETKPTKNNIRNCTISPKKSRTTQDFSIQTGNTLLSDLKNLKHSLLMGNTNIKGAMVCTMDLSLDDGSKNFLDSHNDKGIQTDVLLGAKRNEKSATVIYQNLTSQNKSLLEISLKHKPIIISPLHV